jgi:hypothetical protein
MLGAAGHPARGFRGVVFVAACASHRSGSSPVGEDDGSRWIRRKWQSAVVTADQLLAEMLVSLGLAAFFVISR